MSRLLTKKKVTDLLLLLGLSIAIFALFRFPEESITAALDGLSLSFNVILPSLFPFFVISSLMIRLGLSKYFGRILEPLMRPLFNVSGPCASAVVLGFVGGYPVGAKTAIGLYEEGHIRKVEAERLLAFSNNSGPAFILGVVGVSIFASSRVGLLLYLIHAIASVLVGILFRFWGRGRHDQKSKGKANTQTPPFSTAFLSSVTSSFSSTLNICAFVIFFTVFIRLLFLTGAIGLAASFLATLFSGFGLDFYWATMLLTGFIELSSGVWGLRAAAGEVSSTIAMAAFMLGWAGLSVHCQVLSFIGGSGLSMRPYILGKTLHGAISAALVFCISAFFPWHIPVSSALAEGVYGIAKTNFSTSIFIASLSAVSICLLVLFVCLFPGNIRKKARQREENGV